MNTCLYTRQDVIDILNELLLHPDLLLDAIQNEMTDNDGEKLLDFIEKV